MSNITMRRKGEFRFKAKGHWHCGIDPADQFITMQYDVEIECRPSLDERGFLVDQMAIQRFFDGVTETDKSCERLVKWCASELCRFIYGERAECEVLSVWLTLSPAPFCASMSVLHQPGAER